MKRTAALFLTSEGIEEVFGGMAFQAFQNLDEVTDAVEQDDEGMGDGTVVYEYRLVAQHTVRKGAVTFVKQVIVPATPKPKQRKR